MVVCCLFLKCQETPANTCMPRFKCALAATHAAVRQVTSFMPTLCVLTCGTEAGNKSAQGRLLAPDCSADVQTSTRRALAKRRLCALAMLLTPWTAHGAARRHVLTQHMKAGIIRCWCRSCCAAGSLGASPMMSKCAVLGCLLATHADHLQAYKVSSADGGRAKALEPGLEMLMTGNQARPRMREATRASRTTASWLPWQHAMQPVGAMNVVGRQ